MSPTFDIVMIPRALFEILQNLFASELIFSVIIALVSFGIVSFLIGLLIHKKNF